MTTKPFTKVTDLQLSKTLAQKFIPLVDRLRDLKTKFGLAPYVVRIIRVRWSGDHRGVGTPSVEKEMDLLPTPKVMDLGTMTEIVQPIGLDETGTILVTEISGRFTDDQLRFIDGQEREKNEEVFYEIEYPQPGGKPTIRRRFYVRGTPFYHAGRLQWQVRLERAHQDRDDQGDLQ